MTRPDRRSGLGRTVRALALVAAGLGVVAVAIGAMHVLRGRSHSASTSASGDALTRPAERAGEPALGTVAAATTALDDYLHGIEARGERDPEVAVMEIENGIEAIHRLADQLGHDQAEQRQRAFADRMRRLAMKENEDVRPDEIASLAARYQQTSEARERDRLRRRYMAALGKLGVAERSRALDRIRPFIEPAAR
jgi:hypothetical protein